LFLNLFITEKLINTINHFLIGSHVNEWNLDAPELFPVFEEAAKLGAAVFVHPWDMMGQKEMPK
jgi:hypothetical protein